MNTPVPIVVNPIALMPKVCICRIRRQACEEVKDLFCKLPPCSRKDKREQRRVLRTALEYLTFSCFGVNKFIIVMMETEVARLTTDTDTPAFMFLL